MKRILGVFLAICMVAVATNYSEASYPVKKDASKVEQVSSDETVDQSKDVWYQEVYTKMVNGGGKSQITALILVCLVGGIGIHRFYLGYTGIGIVQLLTLGGCGIWSLIDLVRIITGDLGPKNGRYSKRL
ncbi:MAG: TM2 domain-containing protein [Luteibaculum sp.]